MNISFTITPAFQNVINQLVPSAQNFMKLTLESIQHFNNQTKLLQKVNTE